MAALFEEQKNPQEYLRSLKSNLIPEEVYVFTPKGKVVDLPPGATALDFAFKIHTEVGLHASGARVNGTAAALKTVLKTGDIVEILTDAGRSPTRAMLAAVTTAGARQDLRRWLNARSRTTSEALGRKLWEKETGKYVLPAGLRREEALAARLGDLLGPRCRARTSSTGRWGSAGSSSIARSSRRSSDPSRRAGRASSARRRPGSRRGRAPGSGSRTSTDR